MSSPYCVLTHGLYCVSCRREVEGTESVQNDDDLWVHLGCGTVLDELGHRLPRGSAQCVGEDIRSVDRRPGTDAEWLADQRAILARLPSGKNRRSKTAKEAVLSILDNTVQLMTKEPQEVPIHTRKLVAEDGKRRRGIVEE